MAEVKSLLRRNLVQRVVAHLVQQRQLFGTKYRRQKEGNRVLINPAAADFDEKPGAAPAVDKR